MLKLTIYILLLWGSLTPLQAQSQLDWLIKHSEFQPILKKHLDEVRGTSHSTVSAVLFKTDVDNLTVYLTVYTYLTEAKDHLPASFTTVMGQPFLIYDGSELLIENKDSWFEVVKAFVASRLCDNLTYRELLKQPGPKSIKVPCEFIYDATIEKLVFKDDKLIKREVVSRVPYYLK